MFLLFGLVIMMVVGALWLAAFAQSINALVQGQKVLAVVWAAPVLGLALMVISGIDYGLRKAEGSPDKVFQGVFEQAPPAGVSELRGYLDDDELSPAFLSFKASPVVVKSLMGSRFTPYGDGASFEVEDAAWQSAPNWFDREMTAQTKVYRVKQAAWESGQYLFYEAGAGRVRVYYKVAGFN